MPLPLTVLVLTCSEYGQANVSLATSYELALAGANVCISSFASLESRVLRLQEHVAQNSSYSNDKPTGSVLFHECKGLSSFRDAMKKHGVDYPDLPHRHGFFGALKSLPKTEVPMFPWDAEEHLAGIETIKDIIAKIEPHIAVVDTLFLPAIDACKLVGQKFVVLLPTAIKEIVAGLQPRMAVLWKYPAAGSGFPFPIKWWQKPLNVYINMRFWMLCTNSERVKEAQAMRDSLGIDATYPSPGVPHICPALPETDYPFSVITKETVPCGPIVMPFTPLEKSDPELMTWLNSGPTVMVNLGSHFISDANIVREMAGAFRILMDHHERKNSGKVQVLWKVKMNGDSHKAIDDIIGKEIQEGRVRVVAWVEAEPVSILQHQNLICTVHHGGANSFFEGVWSGKPHVILPVWYDTYEYAARAEFLKIGIFGNKSCAPGARAKEFGKALVRVTGNSKEAAKFRSEAKRLKDICSEKGEGRKLSAMAILEAAG